MAKLKFVKSPQNYKDLLLNHDDCRVSSFDCCNDQPPKKPEHDISDTFNVLNSYEHPKPDIQQQMQPVQIVHPMPFRATEYGSFPYHLMSSSSQLTILTSSTASSPTSSTASSPAPRSASSPAPHPASSTAEQL